MEVIIIFRLFSFYLKYQVKEGNALALDVNKICYFSPACDAPYLHKRAKSQILLWVEERNHFGISWSIESPLSYIKQNCVVAKSLILLKELKLKVALFGKKMAMFFFLFEAFPSAFTLTDKRLWFFWNWAF